jgi:hypothetical protein
MLRPLEVAEQPANQKVSSANGRTIIHLLRRSTACGEVNCVLRARGFGNIGLVDKRAP